MELEKRRKAAKVLASVFLGSGLICTAGVLALFFSSGPNIGYMDIGLFALVFGPPTCMISSAGFLWFADKKERPMQRSLAWSFLLISIWLSLFLFGSILLGGGED